MEKEFIPYVLSKQIKQLGFNEECFGYYVDVEVANPFLVINRINDTQGGYFTLAPLWQQAFSWCLKKLEDYNITYWYDESGHITYSLLDDCEYCFNSREECLNNLLKLIKK